MTKKGGKKNRAGSESDDSGSRSHPAKLAKVRKGMEMEETGEGGGTASVAPATGVAPQESQALGSVTLESLALMLQRLDTKMDSIRTDNTAAMASLSQKVDLHKQEADARLVALERAVASALPGPAPARWPQLGTASSSASASRSAAAAMGDGGGSTRDAVQQGGNRQNYQNSQNSNKDKKVKVLALGFTREMPRAAFAKHWDKVKSGCPPALVANTSLLASTGKAYSVLFPTAASATSFTRHLRDKVVDTTWQSTKDPAPLQINYRTEKTPEELRIGKLFSPFYLKVKAAVLNSGTWHDSYRFYLDTRRGLLRVESDEEVWTLFTLVEANGTHRFDYDDATLRHFKLHANITKDDSNGQGA
jgi:hypothetical protein